MKFVDTLVSFAEIPDEITLCINISNCPCHCEGCHSDYLSQNIGEELNSDTIIKLIQNNKGITCISLMGGDADHESINRLARFIKMQKLKVGWYSGRDWLDLNKIDVSNFDYIKIGSWQENRGPLNSETTNQVFFKVINKILYNQTYKFLKHSNL